MSVGGGGGPLKKKHPFASEKHIPFFLSPRKIHKGREGGGGGGGVMTQKDSRFAEDVKQKGGGGGGGDGDGGGHQSRHVYPTPSYSI